MRQHTSLPTEMRRRVQRALKTRNLRGALRSTSGAIDLASIMVGVIVIGVIAGVIAATVFAVIPWSQNAAAKQSLDAVRTAEAVTRVQDNQYADMAGLVAASRIQTSKTVSVGTDTNGTCYVGVSKSATGKVFYITDAGPDVKELGAATVLTCTIVGGIDLLVTSVGGPDPATAPLPDQFATLTAVQRTAAGTRLWDYVASSADGKKLVASVSGANWTTPTDNLYTSTDSGVTWIAQPGSGVRQWISLASSADGTKLAAATEGSGGTGTLYLSGDSGVTWAPQTDIGVGQFSGLSMSANGQIIYANGQNTYGQYTTNGGLSWSHIQYDSYGYTKRYSVVAASSDGVKMIGAVDNYMYLTSDATYWTSLSPTPMPTVGNRTALSVSGLASSANGQTLAASFRSYYNNLPSTIFTSSNSGLTWTEQVGAGIRLWSGLSMSADGTKIVAADADTGYLYTSKDSGATWVERIALGKKTWTDIAMSADGSKLVATDRKNIYTLTFGP